MRSAREVARVVYKGCDFRDLESEVMNWCEKYNNLTPGKDYQNTYEIMADPKCTKSDRLKLEELTEAFELLELDEL